MAQSTPSNAPRQHRTLLNTALPADDRHNQSSPSRRVLWIDDEVSENQAEPRYLSTAGLMVCCAQTGDAGLSRLEVESFDAILLDLNMPGRSGVDVLEALLHRKNRIPVLVLTGFGTMERAVAAMKLGAVDVLSKPVDLDLLVARLREVKAQYPHGVEPTSITEAEWVRLQCERVSDCINRDDVTDIVLHLLLSERVTLRYFHGCAKALRLLLTSQEESLTVLKSDVRASILAAATAPWPRDSRLHDALMLLESRPTKQSYLMFADRSGLSRTYLSRRLHRATGHHPSDWCRAAELREGLRRLVKTSDPIRAIAHELGQEHSQFTRAFAGHFFVTPSAFRNLAASMYRPESTQS